jgi:hypothetical protein
MSRVNESGVIVSTKEIAGTYDALETAKPGEPIFVLQGGDMFAPATVQHWADLARRAGMAETDQVKAVRLLEKASAAEIVGWTMRAYQRGEESGQAQAEKRVPSPDGLTLADNQATQQMVAATAKLHNAAALIEDVREMFAAAPADGVNLALRDDMVKALGGVRDFVNDLAAEINPRKPREEVLNQARMEAVHGAQ